MKIHNNNKKEQIKYFNSNLKIHGVVYIMNEREMWKENEKYGR